MFEELNSMSLDDFKNLTILDTSSDLLVDSLIFLPLFNVCDSGFSEFSVVAVCKGHCLGRLPFYDTFSIFMNSSFNRVGFDCLSSSGCMRVFLPPNEYKIRHLFHDCVHINSVF